MMSIILLVIGALVGAVVTYLIAGQRSTDEPEDAQAAEKEPAQTAVPVALVSSGFKEAARLWRNAEGHLAVQMNGSTFTTAKDMNPAAKEKADTLAHNWLTWLGKNTQPQTAPPVREVDENLLEELNLGTPAAAPIASRPLLVVEDETDKLPDIPKESIVVQIDNILQDMLAGSALEDRGIHLDEGLNMGVIVWVGSQSFQGIDQVSDPVIAKVIQKAVAEWERRSVPNR
jgi:hypothetical protein